MRNIYQIYQFFVYLVRKQIGGSLLTIQEAMQALNSGQLDAVETWFADYGVNQKIHDAIRQLRVYQPFTSDSSGMVTYPSDYLHSLGTPFTVYGSAVTNPTFKNEDEVAFALTSKLRPVDMENPMIVNTATGFSIYPQATQVGAYWYLRLPAAPVLGYTQNGREITYDQSTSTQLEFTDVYVNNILARALQYVGVNMSENEISAFANVYNKETT